MKKMRITMAVVMAVLSLSTMAQVTDRKGVKDVNGVVDNTPDSIAKAMTARPVPGSSRSVQEPWVMETTVSGVGATMPMNTSIRQRLPSRIRRWVV